MKTLQISEVMAGIATFVCIFLFIYFVDYPSSKGVAELHKESFAYNWTGAFLILILPSFLIAASSYFHAFRRSYISLAVIVILGGALSFLNFLALIIGSAFEGHVVIGILPGLFAFLTIILAVYNAVWALIIKLKIKFSE